MVLNKFPWYDKAIVYVSLSNPMIENSTLDYAKTGYIVEKDEDVNSEVINYAQTSYGSAFSNSQSFSLTSQSRTWCIKNKCIYYSTCS